MYGCAKALGENESLTFRYMHARSAAIADGREYYISQSFVFILTLKKKKNGRRELEL